MKWLMAMIGILGVVWLCGIFLEAPPVARVIDNDVGMSVPQPGTSVWRFTEGNSNTRFKEHGLNAALPDGRANIYLHGDSYIEGLMLSDEKKPDVVLTKALGGTNLVWGIGRSGIGIPSFIVHAREYERVFGVPRVHVFFVTSSDDILGDQGDEYVWDREGVSKCAPRTSPSKMKLIRFVNKYHLNFLISCYNNFNRLKKRRWHLVPGISRGDTSKQSSDESAPVAQCFEALCGEIKRTVKAPVLFVYCPHTPVLANGSVTCSAGEECFLKVKGVDIVDVSPALNSLYAAQGVFPRGFDNASGPGDGHLNALGVEAVFSYVAKYMKEKYGL